MKTSQLPEACQTLTPICALLLYARLCEAMVNVNLTLTLRSRTRGKGKLENRGQSLAKLVFGEEQPIGNQLHSFRAYLHDTDRHVSVSKVAL